MILFSGSGFEYSGARMKLNTFLIILSLTVIFGSLVAFMMGYDLSIWGTLAWVAALFTIGIIFR